VCVCVRPSSENKFYIRTSIICWWY